MRKTKTKVSIENLDQKSRANAWKSYIQETHLRHNSIEYQIFPSPLLSIQPYSCSSLYYPPALMIICYCSFNALTNQVIQLLSVPKLNLS